MELCVTNNSSFSPLLYLIDGATSMVIQFFFLQATRHPKQRPHEHAKVTLFRSILRNIFFNIFFHRSASNAKIVWSDAPSVIGLPWNGSRLSGTSWSREICPHGWISVLMSFNIVRYSILLRRRMSKPCTRQQLIIGTSHWIKYNFS